MSHIDRASIKKILINSTLRMCNHHPLSLEIVYAHIIDANLLVYQAFMHEGEKGVYQPRKVNFSLFEIMSLHLIMY